MKIVSQRQKKYWSQARIEWIGLKSIRMKIVFQMQKTYCSQARVENATKNYGYISLQFIILLHIAAKSRFWKISVTHQWRK